MNYLIASAALFCLIATAFGQTCNEADCRASASCHKLKREAMRLEGKQCMERCAANAGVSQCMKDREGPSPGFETCMEQEICSSANMQKVEEFKSMMSGRFGGMRGMEGSGHRGGRHGHSGGKGHHCGKMKGKGKMLQYMLGDYLTPQAEQFIDCMADCFDCAGEEDGPQCPEAQGCMMKGLKISAMKTCKDRENDDMPDKQEKCECMVRTLAPSAPSDFCSNMMERFGGKGGKGKFGGRGGPGGFPGGKGQGGSRFGGSRGGSRGGWGNGGGDFAA